jgi:hypothetical protein
MLFCLKNTNIIEFWGQGEVKGRAVEGEEKEKKEKIDLKVSTKFQIILSTNS